MNVLTRDTVLFALACHVGEASGISARDLVTEICGDTTAGDERALRSIIDELRHEGAHICGLPSTGYFMAANEAELLRTCDFLFKQSTNGLEQIAAMRRVSLPDFRGQLRLPHEFPAGQPPPARPGPGPQPQAFIRPGLPLAAPEIPDSPPAASRGPSQPAVVNNTGNPSSASLPQRCDRIGLPSSRASNSEDVCDG